MSDSVSPYIDLSGGYYDNVEYELCQKLGLKLIMVRNWACPVTCGYKLHADGSEEFTSDDPAQRAMARAIHEWQNDPALQEESDHPLAVAQIDSLSEYLHERDPEIAGELSMREVVSLMQCRHVTVRTSACDPLQAVIIHDSIVPEQSMIPALMGQFIDPWTVSRDMNSARPIKYADMIDNFPLTPLEYRVYKALLHTRYALRNQNEFDSLGQIKAESPFYHRFADLAKPRPVLTVSPYLQSYTQARDFIDVPAADMVFATLGIDGRRLQQKMLHLYAIHNLMAGGSATGLVMAGIHQRYGDRHMPNMSNESARSYGDALGELLAAELSQRAPSTVSRQSMIMQDPRVIIPLFREVKDYLTSDTAGQLLAGTTWEAVQEMFPTLARQPVPSLVAGDGPLKSLEAHRLKERIAEIKGQGRSAPAPGSRLEP